MSLITYVGRYPSVRVDVDGSGPDGFVRVANGETVDADMVVAVSLLSQDDQWEWADEGASPVTPDARVHYSSVPVFVGDDDAANSGDFVRFVFSVDGWVTDIVRGV